MNKGNKRQRENEPEKATSNKKQVSLLTMFKPVSVKKDDSGDLDAPDVKPEDRGALFKNVDADKIELLDLEIKTMNYEWLKVLAPELVKPYFLNLKRFLNAELAAKKVIFPPLNQIYSWSNYTPPSKVEVVVLGQDPYHNYNQAHGLCFSVVKGVRVPPSLLNIYKAIKNDYPDFKTPDHGFLENWAKQGVLLLNTSLSVEAHKAGSHANQGWEHFTDAVINYLNEKKSNLVFILWGSHAQKKGAKINKNKHLILRGVHPSPLSAHKGFFDCQHFKKTNEYLIEHGKSEINWNCLA
ncbi:MAG: uracil-DNA glycosylase-like protein [Benjaminiella poitrasii]|nr:MAG: uracil-DNA glycosylase-like protein [Benjaminiella poitrasii]